MRDQGATHGDRQRRRLSCTRCVRLSDSPLRFVNVTFRRSVPAFALRSRRNSLRVRIPGVGRSVLRPERAFVIVDSVFSTE